MNKAKEELKMKNSEYLSHMQNDLWGRRQEFEDALEAAELKEKDACFDYEMANFPDTPTVQWTAEERELEGKLWKALQDATQARRTAKDRLTSLEQAIEQITDLCMNVRFIEDTEAR
jgi:hypothetical protein